MASSGAVRTWMLILSDTHGMKFSKDWPQLQGEFYLAIHCGDLTEESRLSEFSDTLDLLRDINAPPKLVIAGNHDLTLDPPAFKTVPEPGLDLDDPAVLKEYGAIGEARQLLASDPDIRLLDEGTQTQLHFFGHIHVGWGTKLVTWRGDGALDTDMPSHFTDIDNGMSAVIRDLKRLKEWKGDNATLDRMDETDKNEVSNWLTDLLRSGCDATRDNGLRLGEQTIFVNAAVKGSEDLPIQPPIVAELELPQQVQGL